MRKFLAGASRAALLGLLCLSAQAATTFTITTTSMAKAVDGVCTFQEVLEVLRTSTTVNECVDANGPYTINLVAGTYTVTTATDTSAGNSAARVNFDTTIEGNGAVLAAGAANLRAFLVDAPLTLRDLAITGFAGAANGTVFVVIDGQLNLERVVVTGNGTAGRPVIDVQCNPCETNLHQSAFYANLGSAAIEAGNGTAMNIANSTLDASVPSFIAGSSTSINLSNATIQGGITGTGAGGSSLRLGNSIFNGPCTLSVGWNVVYLGTAAYGDDCGGADGEGTQPLDDNGGATRTYATTRGASGAVDATPAACAYTSTGTNPLFASGGSNTVDQRGQPRDAACDSGAYESAFPPTIPDGVAGVAYSTTPVAGAALAQLSGTLPGGLSLVGGALQGTPTAAGPFTFRLQANRAGGFKDFGEYTITITTAPPPGTTITAMPPNASATGTSTFSFTGVDNGAGIAGFLCSVDGAAFSTCASPYTFALANGTHSFQVLAIDNATTVDPTPASYTWIIDTIPPNTTITSGPPSLTNVDSTSIGYTGSDPGGSGIDTFECQLDAGGWSTCPASPVGFIGIGDGTHTARIRAIDNAGNMDATPDTHTWTIDTIALPPVIASPATASTIPPNPPLSGAGEAGALVTVREGAAPVCTATVAGGGTWTCTTTLGDGAHTIDATQLDAAGNTSAASAAVTFTVVTPVNSYSAPSATGSGMITASFTGGGATCTYGVSQYIPVTGNPASPPAGSAPAGVAFPHGLFDFTTTGCTPGSSITMTIAYPSALQRDAQYYKYGPTPADPAPHWYVLPATILGNTVTFTIVDGGLGDDDLAANGTVVDQGGPGLPAGGAAAVPTLGLWGMLLLIAGMLVVGRRRWKA